MVRFSCFNGNIINNINKPKKSGSSFVEAMNILQGSSKGQTLGNSLTAAEPGNAAFPSIERDWNSYDLETTNHSGFGLKKSNSEIGLHTKGKVSEDEETDDNEYSLGNSVDNSRSMIPDASNDQELSPSQKEKSIFSIEYPQLSEKGASENSDVDRSSGRNGDNSGDRPPQTPQSITRSQSLPNFSNLAHGVKRFAPRSRSSEELYVLDKRQSEVSVQDVKLYILPEEEERNYGDDDNLKNANDRYDDTCDDHYNFNYESSAREWIVPITDDHSLNEKELSSVHHRNDFKWKRIEEWVFDLQPCNPLEGINEMSGTEIDDNNHKRRETTATNGSSSSKIIPGMEAAKRYISALNPTATSAQLSNHGLAVIPFLGAFVNLKVLNLSGNAIVSITAGALPRGLHMLNLSKNHISVIEGLRELSRLRVLDLSYNKIFRIGHGLASCSSLKELYLAGNKISEVEGLHRLLKLSILDLRFNKISTAKCLGQLAANYNSLQAISLEGNPAQKNVGDESLKKYLQGLLPNLAYYNRQFIKVRAKEGGERSVRLLIGASGIRSADYKSSRKGGSSKVRSSSHGRRNQGLDRVAKGKHVRLVHGDAKGAGGHHHGEKMKTLRPESIRKSHSVGNLSLL